MSQKTSSKSYESHLIAKKMKACKMLQVVTDFGLEEYRLSFQQMRPVSVVFLAFVPNDKWIRKHFLLFLLPHHFYEAEKISFCPPRSHPPPSDLSRSLSNSARTNGYTVAAV
ncbi:hypothetical protein TNCT_123021 [Trichonephila clavata]|uniref:Uncharacterized protein n=1 Tax=Trichonephila clavata TaxID=2740835 RepID=A0A8X6GQS5_TRICU|nr:hypothetical protein TNCT_123021 [Trichonephila clavata]